MSNWEHGTARWSTDNDLANAGHLNREGIILGYRPSGLNHKWTDHYVSYNGDQHLITVAPTRTGKGTTMIIPALLDYKGGVFCIDPKGENAIITAETRERDSGQPPAILDPWGKATSVLGRESAAFNPLDTLHADSDELLDDATVIADACIWKDGGGEQHWSNSAANILSDLICYVVVHPDEEGQRHLGRVRDILTSAPDDMLDVFKKMQAHDNRFLQSGGNRFFQKQEREMASIISTVHQNTAFLDSPQIRRVLERSTFDFAALKSNDAPLSVYLVIPAERLETHSRWLRLIVSMAITSIVRTKGKPSRPALLILDEFAQLGRLTTIEQAFSLMAGFGLQIWAILQDLSQLQDLYRNRWQTFIANAGVVQCFGARDMLTAEYISKLCGTSTITVAQEGQNTGTSSGQTHSSSSGQSISYSKIGRPLLTPDEVMKLDYDRSLLFFSGLNVAAAYRHDYFINYRYWTTPKDGEKSKPAYRFHPDYPFNEKQLRVIRDHETYLRFKHIMGDDANKAVEIAMTSRQPNKKGGYLSAVLLVVGAIVLMAILTLAPR